MLPAAIDLDKARRLARARNDSHGGFIGVTAYPQNRVRAHEIGAIGEMCMAETYGLPLPRLRRSGGDDGYDFFVQLPDCAMRIDVKTFRNPRLLIVPLDEIKRARANLYVMVHCDDNDCPRILGWQHRSVIARARVGEFKLGAEHFIARERLRRMADFERLFAKRIAA